jgi:hypothetical protein
MGFYRTERHKLHGNVRLCSTISRQRLRLLGLAVSIASASVWQLLWLLERFHPFIFFNPGSQRQDSNGTASTANATKRSFSLLWGELHMLGELLAVPAYASDNMSRSRQNSSRT